MEGKWLRPVKRPVSPREVGEFSSPAVKVLQALRRRFQYQRPRASYQPATRQSEPLPFFGIAQSQAIPAVSQGARRNGCQARAVFDASSPAAAALNESFLPRRQESFSSMCHNGETSFSEVTLRPTYDFPPLSPAPSTSNHEGDILNITSKSATSWDEAFEIVMENNTAESRQSFSTSPVMTGPMRTSSAANSCCSSPMSTRSINIDEVAINIHATGSKYQKPVLWNDRENINEFKGNSQTNDPIIFSKAHAMSNSAHSGLCIGSSDEIPPCSSINLSDESTLVDRNKSFADNLECERISIKPNVEEVTPECQEEHYHHGHVEENLSNTCSVVEVANPPGSVVTLKETAPLEWPQVIRTPSSRRGSDASDMFSDYSFDINSSNEVFHGPSKTDFLHENLPQSPKEAMLCNKIKSPDQTKRNKRKFLGTPFRRALSSSNISCREQSEENKNRAVATLQQETRKNDNREPLKSHDDNIMGSPMRDRQEYNSPSIHTELHENEDPERISSPNRTGEETPKEATNTLFFPIFAASSQVKRKTVTESKGPPPLPCKKKLKFSVPYKKTDETKGPSTPQKIQELAAKLSRKVIKKGEIQKLTEKLANDIIEQIRLTPPEETCLTLQYRGGFSQLNRLHKSKSHLIETIVLRIVWSSAVQFVAVPLQTNSWCSLVLRRIFSDKSRKICFDAQEIFKFLVQKYGFPINEVFSQWLVLDPLVGCWLLNPDEPPHSFKDILKFFNLSEECNGLEKQLEKLSQCVQILYERLTKNETWKLFLHVEMRITPILACMELQGIQLNVKKLQEMAILLKDRLEAVQKAAYDAAGRQFQLTSPQQLSAILYDYLKLDTKHNISVKGTDKRQSKSTSESMLVKFKELHPLPGIILEFRGLHKLKSTYVDAYLGQVSGDRIYTTWDQTSAATGRIQSNEPNLQTIPKQPLMPDLPLRTAFEARSGYSFLAADFQHIELRVFAHLSKDTALIHALSQTTDVFEVLSTKWLLLADTSEVSEEDRDRTKRIVYALMYGAGPSKLVEILQIDFNKATELHKKFSSTFPKMKDFTKTTIDKCQKQGYLATESGRRRLFPQITNSNPKLRQHCERQAVNFLIQGTAADLCKCAMVHTQRHIAALSAHKATVAQLLLQIHDELLWEVPDSDLEEVTGVVQEAMEGATSILQSMSSFSVPLPVLMKVGKTWGSMKTIKDTVLLGSVSQQTSDL